MNFFDCHAHLADSRLSESIDSILIECERQGVKGIIAAAARLSEWSQIIRLSQTNPIVYGALGLHPFFVDTYAPDLPGNLCNAITQNPKIIAVGEIGLDFYHGRDNMDIQLKAFESQLAVAVSLGKPVILHNRKSWNEFFPLWNTIAQGKITGICHHFTGSTEIARQALDAGLYLSFCGPLTYPDARRLKEAARFTPLDRILTETDTPDLPAQPYRETGASRPWHVKDILTEIARLKNLPPTTIAQAIESNMQNIFKLPKVPGASCSGPVLR